MTRIIDLSHVFADGMPGFRMRNKSGDQTEFTARIRPFLTHEQSEPNYQGKASFEITEVSFQTSLGTYLDSPRHRFPGRADIADLALSSLILDGVLVDARHATPEKPVSRNDLPLASQLEGKAVLIHFGWDLHWGTPQYYTYPYVERDGLRYLRDAGIRLFGVDALNADSASDLERPAHTGFLGSGVHIVENLTDLCSLRGKRFRFFAIPIKAKGAAAFPVRAFAELYDE